MEAIIVVGILVVTAAAALAVAVTGWARGRLADRETARLDREAATGRAHAEWRVDVTQHSGATQVLVQRMAPLTSGSWRPLDEPVIVASVPQDSASYEVDLDRAAATARQRARQLNGLLGEDRTS